MYPILSKKPLAPSITLMEIEAPEVARKARAGQFVILRLSENGERIPLTIADFDRQRGTVTIIFQEVGYTTGQLAAFEPGDALPDFVGPLGLPSEVENYGHVVCVGGGVGIAPVYPIARALKEAGNEVTAIVGARSKDLLILEEEMRGASDRLLVATDDGSYGHKGFVTDLVKQVLDEGRPVARLWAVGPMIMMRNVAEVTRPYGVRTIVSLNPIMVDGTGMCGACRVVVGGRARFACVDGPEFDGHEVDWDLAMRRLAMYREEEQQALAFHRNGGGCACR
ncbi:MAG: sulfide/dihydroorotate dehydrogenase-like FAD/NAD-binding protein [Clostridia bacterium]|nr:sulfide/dihydroorotate dehydrogenase-like FAD/NAD-binding protein [Clostridia bacterium]MDH7573587.1 sulfide/dihydroorotate dehydrogenase-like FAD/NAD-binding protein [Clostridia bacterium]